MTALFEEWIGKTHQQNDVVTRSAVERFCATTGVDLPNNADHAPLGFHWCLCLPDAPQTGLGVDGHPAKGGFLPPIEAPRRMWASSKVKFLAPIPITAKVERVQTIKSVSFKEGKTGPLYFVDVDHSITADRTPVISEVQTIVYREAGIAPVLPKSVVNIDLSDWSETKPFVPDETLLFRFSALTFNAHRIHYDLTYAQREESYPALVVHGPLTATVLLHHAATIVGDKKIASYDFTGKKPAFCNDKMILAARKNHDGIDLAALNSAGEIVMSASVFSS